MGDSLSLESQCTLQLRISTVPVGWLHGVHICWDGCAGEGTGALTEAGIFNASSSGTMLCRTEFSVVNKGASDSMTITWTVTVS